MKSALVLLTGLTMLSMNMSNNPIVRNVSPNEADLVVGAAGCPIQPLNPGNVCTAGSTADGCTQTIAIICWTSSPCPVTCSQAESQKITTAGCSSGLPICTTVPQVPATSQNANCNANTSNVGTCVAGFWGCYCGNPMTVVNCPASTFTQWVTCN